MKLSCCTANNIRELDGLNLDETQNIFPGLFKPSQQQSIPPNIILAENFSKTVPTSIHVEMAEHFLKFKNFESMKPVGKINTNFSIFNTVNTMELPEGSSNFMQTTNSMTD